MLSSREYFNANLWEVEVSDAPFTEDDFKSAKTCEGNFCYVQLITSSVAVEILGKERTELGLVGWGEAAGRTADYLDSDSEEASVSVVQDKTFELAAGCLTLTDKGEVSKGCSEEWATDRDEPTRQHCVCDTHMCNYWTQLSEESLSKSAPVFIPIQVSPCLHPYPSQPRLLPPNRPGVSRYIATDARFRGHSPTPAEESAKKQNHRFIVSASASASSALLPLPLLLAPLALPALRPLLLAS